MIHMRRSLTFLAAGLLICAGSLIGCGSSASTSAPSQAASAITVASAPTSQGTVTIHYEENAQVEIIAPTGRRILIDVWNAAALSKPPTASDILLTTHGHVDHYVAAFVDSFPGKKITIEEGSLKLDDVNIVSIPAAHDQDQPISAKDGSDYIFGIDFAGFRFAHFGDLGQNKVSDEQLAKIGKVDVAFSQLANPHSSMDEVNRKGFNLMNQVKPKLLITTHVNLDAVKLAPTIWKTAWATGPITISKDKLPTELTCLVMGTQAANYAKIYNFPAFAQ
jgi:L-ascorbate metabolism protein UlaG (beta-lactamase superfamily)